MQKSAGGYNNNRDMKKKKVKRKWYRVGCAAMRDKNQHRVMLLQNPLRMEKKSQAFCVL